ncbi:sarcosine oxidase subunit gamma [Paracoccus pacificus]|uniref:Sarcosine oxidase subunit gamma n=1 Tax=Paracoccus pacificus TaxID=1463598 RepID=A0ABW4R5J3_9RHOB
MADQTTLLKPVTAFGAETARVDRIGAITITEDPGVALASVAARLGATPEAIPRPEPGQYTEADGRGALWTGPGQWMIIAPLADAPDLAGTLAAELGKTASVTDQTDAWVCFRIDVTDRSDDTRRPKPATALFERLCNLDIARMDGHSGTRTIIEHLGCLVICHQADRRFTVLGPRSSAGSLHHALTLAAKTVATREG